MMPSPFGPIDFGSAFGGQQSSAATSGVTSREQTEVALGGINIGPSGGVTLGQIAMVAGAVLIGLYIYKRVK